MLKYPHMFAPLTIKGVTFKNRVMDAPKTTDRTVFPGGTPTPECINGYEVRARGGVGCVTITESFVDDDRAARHDHTIDFYTPNKSVYHQEALFVLAEAITRHGAVASVELNHAGCVNHPDTIKDHKNPFGPSAFVREDGVQVEEMTEADMHEVADHFAQAALGAKLAGFQMVMLHGGHGWLLGQFVSPLYTNLFVSGTDSHSLRMRFIVSAVTTVIIGFMVVAFGYSISKRPLTDEDDHA